MYQLNIRILIMVIILAGITPSSAVSVNLGSTDPGLFDRIDSLSQYGIENWTDPESPIYDPAVFKAYGKVPPIHNATQLNEFAYNLRSVRESSWDEIEFYPNGHVVQYGCDPHRGYFLVELYDDGTAYSEKHTQKIYDIVDKYALEKGIQDVPVVFTLTKDTSIIGFVEFPVYLYDIDEEQQANLSKDASQLQMEALEMELGEEGMQEVDDYLELQASLPDVVKASPYSYIAFAATDKESQTAYLTAIDESDLDAKKKAKLKADLQDIWNRYPDGFVITDNLVLRDVDKIMAERFIASEKPTTAENGDSASQDNEPPEQTPGFTSAMLILCLLLLGGIQRKLF